MKTKLIFIIISIFLVSLLSVLFVQGNVLYCLSDNDQLPPGCSGEGCRYTCNLRSGLGFCQICTTDSGFPGVNPNTCFGQTCSFLGGGNGGNGGGVDTEHPVLIINNPVDGEFYGSRRVIFDIEVDSNSRLEYKVNDDTSWHKLCNNCMTYNRHVRLDEGLNEVMIRAKKLNNNLITEESLSFNVDSRKPDFRKSWPKKGTFANGEFTVEYTEENLDRVEFYYRGMEGGELTLLLVDGCESGKKETCSITLDETILDIYENGELDYYFNICDKATCDAGKVIRVRVDSTPPILTVNTPFESGYDVKKIPFDISINEEVDLFYVDNNDGRDPHKRRRLCNGCDFFNKGVRFRDGAWDITIFAEDEAGNFDFVEVQFFVDTKKPKIHKQIPNRGWANGEFTVVYTETMLFEVDFYYGNENFNFVTLEGCESGKRKSCSVDVDLSQYDGGEVMTYFVVTDNYNSVSSKVKTLDVDVTDPMFTKFLFTQDENIITFDLEISEVVDVEYMDLEGRRPRFKSLCRNKDVCVKDKRFKDGDHNLILRAFDEAGNFDEGEIIFSV